MPGRYIIRDPLALYREGVIKRSGYDAWLENIHVVEYIADSLKKCLGPKGSVKLVTSKFDETSLTSHGAAILEKMDLHHPAAKLLREAAKTVDKTIGDGTKMTVIIVGGLLKKAESLTSSKIRVGKIIYGYSLAYRVAFETLKTIRRQILDFDAQIIRKLLRAFLYSRNIPYSDYLSEILTRMIVLTLRNRNTKIAIDKDAIKIMKKLGSDVQASRLIEGVVIENEIAHPSMPRMIKNAKIAVLNMALKIDEFRHLQPYKYHIDIRRPEDVNNFLSAEIEVVRGMVEKIKAVGANVVVCRKKIGPEAKQMLANSGIIGVSRLLNEEEFNKIAKITGAHIVSSVEELREEDLGVADIVREEKVGDKKLLVIEGGDLKGVTLLIRSSSQWMLDEVEHAVKDAITYISSALEEPYLLPGGGATEMALATAIRKEALRQKGHEQNIMLAVANSIEALPAWLVRNAGYDALEVLTDLRAKHLNGDFTYGFDALSGKVMEMYDAGVLEPFSIKEQVLKTAFETTTMLLRIDGMIDRRYAKRHEGELGGQ